jgi:hypothetical protein
LWIIGFVAEPVDFIERCMTPVFLAIQTQVAHMVGATGNLVNCVFEAQGIATLRLLVRCSSGEKLNAVNFARRVCATVRENTWCFHLARVQNSRVLHRDFFVFWRGAQSSGWGLPPLHFSCRRSLRIET